MRRRPFIAASLALALAACGSGGAPEREPGNEGEPEIITINQSVTEVPAGTTPMAERTAILHLLNKRNLQERDLTLRPGQAVRIGDVVVRLLACETTAPWEEQRLTGAFVQLDVRNPQGQFQRVFSGWLWKESPSLNVVEHAVYDVSTKSCAMTHPEAGESTVRAGSAASNRSSAPNSPAPSAGRAAAPKAAPEASPAESGPSASDNSIR